MQLTRLIIRTSVASAVPALIMLAGPPASAQERYPTRPIEFIVPWGPGGGADQVARKSAVLMEKALKVSLPVLNVPGATGQTGLTKMLNASADEKTYIGGPAALAFMKRELEVMRKYALKK